MSWAVLTCSSSYGWNSIAAPGGERRSARRLAARGLPPRCRVVLRVWSLRVLPRVLQVLRSPKTCTSGYCRTPSAADVRLYVRPRGKLATLNRISGLTDGLQNRGFIFWYGVIV
ncbi:hypothetical protein EYF80_045223 [Liparis tanakae]|uniref:Uncharacterized protein n=1 Tax=Liparis tanakae TaxID=230148 RepID=A0A4Z2FU95_9TELE|nr:hypothetical protein EYF80_045223 [Liparis tanakae]